MKIKISMGLILSSTLCILLSVSGCKKSDFGKPVILVTGTEVNPLVKFAVAATPATYAVTATSTEKSQTDVNVTFALDTAAVTRYNAEHNTAYYAVPDSAIDIEGLSTVINAGSSTSTPVTVKVISTSPLIDGRSYLIPLSIKTISSGNGMSVLESSKTIFLRIARVYNFSALSMNNSTGATTGSPGTRGHFNACAFFNNPITLSNFTLEIKNLIYDFRLTGDGNSNPQPIQTLGAWENLDESQSIGLRYGELGSPGNALQLIGTLGSAFIYDFNPNQWYTISITYDGKTCTVYIDGVAKAQVTGSMVLPFSRMNLGQSWGGYDTKQYVNGRIAECRVWNRCLTPGEIQLNLCGADPNADGLVCYWKMNEGSGYVFHNSATTGSQYDMDWTHVYWDPTGSGTAVLVDKSQYVTWTSDALNTCSQ